MQESLRILKNELKAAVRSHRKELLSRFPDEKFYGYSLYTSDEVSSIGPVANTEMAIKVPASDSMYNYYRFSADEWHFWDDFGLFEEVNRVIGEIHDGSEQDFGDTEDAILRETLNALKKLEAEGLFGSRSRERFVVLWLSDSGNPIINESAEQLNSPYVYKAYATEFANPSEG